MLWQKLSQSCLSLCQNCKTPQERPFHVQEEEKRGRWCAFSGTKGNALSPTASLGMPVCGVEVITKSCTVGPSQLGWTGVPRGKEKEKEVVTLLLGSRSELLVGYIQWRPLA